MRSVAGVDTGQGNGVFDDADELGLRDDQTGSAVGEYMCDLEGLPPSVDGHGIRPARRDGQRDLEELDVVAQHDRNAVAAGEVGGGESCRELSGPADVIPPASWCGRHSRWWGLVNRPDHRS